MGPPQGRAEGEENLPPPAGHTPLDAPKDAIGVPNIKSPLSAFFYCIFQADFFPGFRERRDCFFVCRARRVAVQEVNWLHPDVPSVRAKASDSVRMFSFPSTG